ncbi:hypothetical protein GQ53DRAFT_588897, partial [Thozetella sp. PMI_491]
SLLPASFMSRFGTIVPAEDDMEECIKMDLKMEAITMIARWLWLAGAPRPPHALHHHVVLGREIILTEQMEKHLVWQTDRIFIKPVPRYLLDPDFWSRHMCCRPNCGCDYDLPDSVNHCGHRLLRQNALGLLFSYTALIRHESDFVLAKEKHLFPAEVQWREWRNFVRQLKVSKIQLSVHRRFLFGELRMERLEMIYFFIQGSTGSFSGCPFTPWSRAENFQLDVSQTMMSMVFIIVILVAMQLGLGTDSLRGDSSFQAASYGFAIFCIIAPI